MKNILKLSALFTMLCLLGLTGCREELTTDQFDDESVVLSAFAPNPAVRGAELRIVGSNLDRIVEVQIPGSEAITDIEVVSSGRISEIRVVIPAVGAEEASVTGHVVIVDDEGRTYESKDELSFKEGIVFDSFTPRNAMPGDVITVKGDYLYSVQQVVLSNDVYVTGEQIIEKSRRELKFIVPSEAVTGPVTIGDVNEKDNPDGLVPNNIPSAENLEIGSPTVKSVDRGMLKAGATIKVEGTFLDMIQSVSVGGKTVDFVLAEDNKSLTVVLPDSVQEGEVILVSYAGEEINAGAYTTVIPTNVAIKAESRYKAGLNAIVTGKDLDLVTGASLAGTALEYAYADNKITFAIPASAVDGTVVLALANGKTVETGAIELVKPTVTEVSPLELYAGDENVIVKGTDLDLVTGVALGGKAADFVLNEDGTLEIVTDATSVSGKIVLTLANGVKIEPTAEIKMNYHALVIVNSMPTAEHIGAKVTLTGANFMLVENIFIGDAKVQSYFTRSDEEVSFVMPYNKVGSYNIYFDLFNGDREMVATPIEVLLEVNYITGWEGRTEITWSAGGRVCVTADKFEGVKPGAKVRFYYTQKDQVWAQAQINYGDWTGLVFPEIGSNTIVPTDIYGWFSDGILDRCTEVTLTQEILDNIQEKKGDYGDENIMNVGLLIQGSDLIFTKIEILQEISQEKDFWVGPFEIGNWNGNQDLAWGGFDWTTVSAGQILTFYCEPSAAANGGWYCISLRVGDNWGALNGVPGQYDNPTVVKVELTQEIIDHLVSANGLVMTGSNCIVNKITIL